MLPAKAHSSPTRNPEEPPYAPDLNPNEFVWQHTKTNGIAKKPLRQAESLRQRVTQDLADVKANRSLVYSFFGAPSVVYA